MENLQEEDLIELIITYDPATAQLDNSVLSFEDSLKSNKLSLHRMSTLLLSDATPLATLKQDKISCDIQSITPTKLRSIIAKMKPDLSGFDMLLYNHKL
jgi:hypothetical protein